ncbi:TetR/AcrR family transcriptional regulator [Actinoallomurus rhizosphaericola]|uniref:TetR/AcrR family transcriptional regulator n=1 Tax=Actinoallomurus rhizosphaericola TaxID=2952536 RepID=UPI002093D975|nr:TetR/AcrR family transcriptional regulator [Actinoallomurus rhizosphaericola]MCO5998992.1 TetR/AcrR family transcriptional regulator [Actinoallomurus rhizosphaericola]
MRTHGWRGDPPKSDEEARRRIIDATARCVDRYGARKTGLTDVAEELGVTRATIYRYYRNIEELIKATSLAAADEFTDRLLAHVAPLGEPADILVEALAFTVERVPVEPHVGLLLATGRTASFGAEMLSPIAIRLTRDLLERLSIDWPAHGYDDAELSGLAEFLLRLLHSYIPGPEHHGTVADDPRPFLRRWLVPAFAAARPEDRVRYAG